MIQEHTLQHNGIRRVGLMSTIYSWEPLAPGGPGWSICYEPTVTLFIVTIPRFTLVGRPSSMSMLTSVTKSSHYTRSDNKLFLWNTIAIGLTNVHRNKLTPQTVSKDRPCTC